jgi:hypothetical protein
MTNMKSYSREATAIHEAGHAVAHYHFYKLYQRRGLDYSDMLEDSEVEELLEAHQIKTVRINKDSGGNWVGETQLIGTIPSVDVFPEEVGKEHIFALIAGGVAEEHATGEWPEQGACGDEGHAYDISAHMGGGSPNLVDEQLEDAREWVKTPQVQAQIEGLAAELMETTSRQGRRAKTWGGEPLWTAVSGENAHRRMADALARLGR